MGKLVVGTKALAQRRKSLSDSAAALEAHPDCTDDSTVCLLIFYAAECGLKARWLSRRKLPDSSAIDQAGHDLRHLGKDLRLPRTVGLEALSSARRISRPNPQRNRAHPGAVELSDLHQAWRYGVKIHPDDEKQIREVLHSVIRWCEQDGR